MQSITTISKYSALLVASVLLLDFFAFAAWIFSGQVPPDAFHAGGITGALLKALLL